MRTTKKDLIRPPTTRIAKKFLQHPYQLIGKVKTAKDDDWLDDLRRGERRKSQQIFTNNHIVYCTVRNIVSVFAELKDVDLENESCDCNERSERVRA